MMYLVVHTGSRNLGKQVAQIYQKLAMKCQSGWAELMEEQNRLIAEYKAAGRKDELQIVIRELHNSFKMYKPTIPADLSYVEGEYREDYLHDMRLCQEWAKINRRLIVGLLMDYLKTSFLCRLPKKRGKTWLLRASTIISEMTTSSEKEPLQPIRARSTSSR